MRSITICAKPSAALFVILCFLIVAVFLLLPSAATVRTLFCDCSKQKMITTVKGPGRDQTLAQITTANPKEKKKPMSQVTSQEKLSLPTSQGRLTKLNPAIPRLSGKGYMYVHPFSDVVSNAVTSTGIFEPLVIRRFIALLKLHPEANFIDFGANIGLYSLIAAHMRRKAFSVEANPLNAAILQKSIIFNKFTSSLTLCNMALAQESNKFVSLATEVGNMGNTVVQDKANSSVILDYNGKVNPNIKKTKFTKIKTITMNDLVERGMVTFPEVIVKMDIQGHELKALKSSENFFKKIKIPAFFIEWVNYQQPHKKNEAKELAEIFLKQGFKPYDPTNMKMLSSDANAAGGWSYDVLLLKNSPYLDLFT